MSEPDNHIQYVTQGELISSLEPIYTYIIELVDGYNALNTELQTLKEKQVATQADVDALTAALQSEDSELSTAVSSLQTSVTAIQAEIAQLQQANPALDLSALTAEVANSQAQADAVQSAVAAAAALVPPPAS